MPLSGKLAAIKLAAIAAALTMASLPTCATDIAVLHNGFSIRHERREQVGPVTRLFLEHDGSGFVDVPSNAIDHFETDPTPTPAPAPVPAPAATPAPVQTAVPVSPPPVKLGIDQVVAAVSDHHHLDPDLINSVIHAESGFNPHAVSPKGARGLMQLMPQTASKLGVANSFDPQANVEGGTLYLRQLLEQYNFDLAKALAAYNAGPHRVDQYKGMPPYYETQAYVARIIRDFNRKKLAERKAATAKAASGKTQLSEKSALANPKQPVSR
jgi:Transglycosylase SLT domain